MGVGIALHTLGIDLTHIFTAGGLFAVNNAVSLTPTPSRREGDKEPELFFDHHRHELICLDEIQLLTEFFRP